jgi:hypothetical protein
MDQPTVTPMSRKSSLHSSVTRLSPALDAFCKFYITTWSLQLPTPFAKPSAAKLRMAMAADPTVQCEQPSDTQCHIVDLLLAVRIAELAAIAEADQWSGQSLRFQ